MKKIILLVISFLLALTSCSSNKNYVYYFKENNEVIIKEISGSHKVFEVLETYKDCPVVRIENNTFNFSGIKELYISKNLKEIGREAFRASINLTTVTIKENSNLNKIEAYAFTDCSSLEIIELYNAKNLKEIGGKVFQNCTSLKEIYIPSSVVTMGPYVFNGCSSDLIINLEVSSIPKGFDENWNHNNLKVNFNKTYIKQE